MKLTLAASSKSKRSSTSWMSPAANVRSRRRWNESRPFCDGATLPAGMVPLPASSRKLHTVLLEPSMRDSST